MSSEPQPPETQPRQGDEPQRAPFQRRDLLRWLYLGRLTVVAGILAGALRAWLEVGPEVTLIATVMFLVALGVTSASFWYTHILGREPGENFLYAQVVLDVLLVTGIVHVTEGPDSIFAPLYILVISSAALLLPLSGGVLIGALASMVYFADLTWGYQGALQLDVVLQIALFTVVALITGLLGDRLRRAGLALGAVESELRQLRLDTGDILANLTTGVVTVDGDGRLAYANPSAETLLGLRSADWLGRPAVDEVERLAPGMGQALQRAIRDGAVVERFRATTRHNGREVRLGISTAVLDRGEDQPPSATAIFQDITDLERLELVDRRAERLEAVATLSASLAHEIKNPLASIRSAVEQLTRSSLSGGDRSTLERLVLAESDRLSRLLSEFLEYSGLQLATQERVELRDLVRDCVDMVGRHPEVSQVELSTRIDPAGAEVIGDADLLHRALFNLVLNGAQASGPGGRVSIELRSSARRTSLRRPGAHSVRLAVTDSGPGIEPELVGRIFDPFFTTRDRGSGLGLAVVHRAVEVHDGVVQVDRAPGGGARFVIYLPAAAEGLEGGDRG